MKYNKNEVTGKMRDRIILQNVNRSRSLTGFASESWADTATIWAFAESKLPGSNETIIDGKNTAKNVCDFTIRYISTITEESRVVWGDKLYQVKNIKVSHDRRFISFQGVFYDSYILTGVNVAASVTGIATTSANLKLIMSVIGQANAIASAIGEIVTAQQGLVEVASSVVANGTSTANVTKVISIDSSIAASANVSAAATIVQFVESSVQAAATSTADVKLTKVVASSVTANATATSAIDVIQQGLVTFEASITATGTATADILRIATLASSPSTAADTSAIATLTRVLEASATATAQTSSDAQIIIPVNANATATANTSANAQLSYTVNAAADATAQTSADAFITRIISANATATANSSAEAGIGVTFVAAAVATATSTNADLFRTATMEASVTASGSITAASITTVDNVAASVSAAATVSATLTTSLLLDLYPSSTAAYSLRKLRTSYTGSAIRVRASTSGAEGDVSFDVNNTISGSSTVTVTAVGTSGLSIGQQVTFNTFWNAGGSNQNVFVTTWYDQSGNAKNATQTTQANQPQIVNNGSILLKNGKAEILFNTKFMVILNSISYFNNFTFAKNAGFAVCHRDDATGYKNIVGSNRGVSSSIGFQISTAPSYALNDYTTNGVGEVSFNQTSNNVIITNTLFLYSIFWDLQNITASERSLIYINNGNAIKNNIKTLASTNADASYDLSIGSNFPSGNGVFNGGISELILYASDQTTNRLGIITNINTHYAIY